MSWSLIGAALLATLLVAACGGGDPELPGTSLQQTPAPDFRLIDQAGREVSLSGLRGKAVVLTFMYSTCPDFCPATAEKLRRTLDLLGKDSGRVAMVAVSVDPERDDRASVQAFSERHRLPDANWHFVTGSETDLAPVWSAYGIGRLPGGTLAPPTPGATAADVLGHTEALYVIDRQGQERTLLRGDFDPAALAEALRTLAR